MIHLLNQPLCTWGPWISVDNMNAMRFERLKEYTIEFTSIITLKDFWVTKVTNPLSDRVGNLL